MHLFVISNFNSRALVSIFESMEEAKGHIQNHFVDEGETLEFQEDSMNSVFVRISHHSGRARRLFFIDRVPFYAQKVSAETSP